MPSDPTPNQTPPSSGKPRRRPAPAMGGSWIWLVVLCVVGLIIFSQTMVGRGQIYWSEFYNLLLDGSSFTYNGHAIRIKQAIRTMSPFNYKVATSVSVDGGPYRNYGNPWWRKETK